MSSEIDHPRQRTVAELLAEHGGGAGGRRRRRRAAESAEGGFSPSDRLGARSEPQLPSAGSDRSPLWEPYPPSGSVGGYDSGRHGPGTNSVEPRPFPGRGYSDSPLREPRQFDSTPPSPLSRGGGWSATPAQPPEPAETTTWRPAPESPVELTHRHVPPPPREGSGPGFSPVSFRSGVGADGFSGSPSSSMNGTHIGPVSGVRSGPRPSPAPVRDRPTELIRPVHDDSDADDLLTRPISKADVDSAVRSRPAPTSDDPVTRAWKAPDKDTPDTGSRSDREGGPPTLVGSAPPGAEAWHRRRVEAARPGAAPPPNAGPVRPDEPPAGLGTSGPQPPVTEDPPVGEASGEQDSGQQSGARRRVVESAGQAWAAVVAQWIAGAMSGAVLWVAFRFLWRSLPVVALAAAALVTAGLVVIVRALLHNDDRRTTLFAVGVGLLLTVSPAILALVGR